MKRNSGSGRSSSRSFRAGCDDPHAEFVAPFEFRSQAFELGVIAFDDCEERIAFDRILGPFANPLPNQPFDLGVRQPEKLTELLKFFEIENPRLIEQEPFLALPLSLAAFDNCESLLG